LSGFLLVSPVVYRIIFTTLLLAAALNPDLASARSARATVIVERALGTERVRLVRSPGGRRALLRIDARGGSHPIACGKLTGAWGLWVTDVNGDKRPDLVIALRKRARHDPVVENRPHVYTLYGHRCVPLWRGTRLAGRFEQLDIRGVRLWALERIGRGLRRVARYRWRGFGYTVERVLWRGRAVPKRWKRRFTKARR
jgi:hypothetical protein